MNTQPTPTTTTSPTTTTHTTASTEALHTLADAQDIIPQSRVVDLLLDLYATSTEPAVRLEIEAALTLCGRRTMLRASELRSCLALIEGAEEVESAFAHLLLAS